MIKLVSDTWVMTRRNLRRQFRIPSQLVYTTALPVMWVLLFVYVFGGSIRVPGASYVDFLLPGILVLSVAFGIANTALGLSDDLASGVLDRFRSQPISRPALLLGRALFDSMRNVLALLIALGVGFAVGFRIHNGLLAAAGAFWLTVAVGFAVSWVGVLLGLAIHDPEAAQTAGTLLSIPVIFASSTFVPVQSMPGWLQAVAANNPVTHAVDAARALILGGPVASDVWATLAWVLGIVAVALPAAVVRYQRVARS
ncbi:MAG TPA: ABC transporter permease [Micromonosporaceae bacterium]|jgi:ABC-2 type transport system permease protein/oleandomycin transport system permease protein|nr:ABC transporter permease [Micromonosporaceae bacterium]